MSLDLTLAYAEAENVLNFYVYYPEHSEVKHAVDAALPYTLDALAEDANAQYTAAIHKARSTEEGYDWPMADDLAAVTNWLRRKAVEVRA